MYRTYLTPFEKFLSLTDVTQYLRDGVTVELLKARAEKESHLKSAKAMQEAKQQLFAKIQRGMVLRLQRH